MFCWHPNIRLKLLQVAEAVFSDRLPEQERRKATVSIQYPS